MKNTLVIMFSVLMIVGCSRDPKVQRDKYFASGQKYLNNKKYEEAAIEFRNAIQLDKGHSPSYLGIAQAFQRTNNHPGAIAAYQEVVKLDIKNIPARLQLGEYLLAAGTREPALFKQAQQMAEEVLKIEQGNVEALILLGNAYSGQNDVDKALPFFEKALSLNPNNLNAMLNLAAVQFRKKDAPLAEETFKKAIQQHPDNIQTHLAIATFYAATQRPQETEKHLKKAFEMEPSNSRSLYSLANYYLSTNRIAEAENVFQEAITRKPADREPRWGLAGFYLQQGKAEMGIQTLNDILKANKGDRPALLRLAEIYVNQNDSVKAEQTIQTILAAHKNDAYAHYLQGKIYRKRKEFDKALAKFEAAIKSDISLAPAYLEKANLLIAQGDLDASEATLKEVLKQNRNYLPARGAYAKLLAIRQRPEDALQQAQDVLALLPDNEDAIGARAEAFRISGKLEESKRDWIKLCEMQPRNSDYWYRLGSVEAKQGNTSAALAEFRKAVELNPNHSAAINDILGLCLKAKQYSSAFAELDRLEALSTPKDEIRKFRGQVFLAKGDLAAAESEFRKAVEINPKNFETYILLAQLNMQRNNLPQAIKEVDQLIARNDKMAAAYLMKAYYLELAKDIAGAKTNYRKVLAMDSENAVAANNLAWLLCEGNNDFEEALSLARAAKKKAPDDPEIAETLGWIYYKMKNYTLATDQLLFSINNRKQPSAENYYRLGMALYAKGDIYYAKQTLRKSLELNDKISGADEARKILKSPS